MFLFSRPFRGVGTEHGSESWSSHSSDSKTGPGGFASALERHSELQRKAELGRVRERVGPRHGGVGRLGGGCGPRRRGWSYVRDLVSVAGQGRADWTAEQIPTRTAEQIPTRTACIPRPGPRGGEGLSCPRLSERLSGGRVAGVTRGLSCSPYWSTQWLTMASAAAWCLA
jgi:hypothetical protein